MRLAALIPLVGCIWNLLLAVFVLSRGVRSPVHRVYFLWGIAVSIWNLGQFALFLVEEPGPALLWARFLWLGVIFIPVLLFHISLLLANVPRERMRWVPAFYAISIVLAVSNFTPLFVRDIRMIPGSGWYAVAGPALFSFNVLFTLAFFSIAILWRRRRELPASQRNRLTALIMSQTGLVILGTNDLLPIVGFDSYPFTNVSVYPYGSIGAVFYGIIIAYSILHHHLIDVQVSLSRTAAQAVRLLFLFVIGIALLLVATLAAPGHFTAASFLLSLGVLMVSAVIASLFFPRLFGGAGEALERRILGDRFEYHDQISAFIHSAQWHKESSVLLAELHDVLVKGVRAGSYQIILLDAANQALSLLQSHPPKPPQAIDGLDLDSPLFRYFQDRPMRFLAAAGGGATPLGIAARAQMRDFSAEFCFPFRSQDEPFGLLLLGPKTSGEPFTATDVLLLSSLADHLSLVINQIRLKGEILRAQELELLGRMSRGMAHDLNNLLTPVQTTLQLAHEGTSVADLCEDLLPLAVRNVMTMRAYIRDALFFSENLRPDLQLGRLDLVIQMAAQTMQAKAAEKEVRIQMEAPADARIEMDQVLIQRMLTNLLSNAIDASAPGDVVAVHVAPVPRPDPHREWLRLQVIDKGEGIAPENLDRIFTPYFTTKNRGDVARGFGLGLAICRQIIDLHGGILDVRSERGAGTTIIVELPSKQLAALAPVEPATTPA